LLGHVPGARPHFDLNKDAMNDFCVERITVEDVLRAEHGVLQPQALRVSADASQAAARLRERAEEDARAIQAQARREAAQAVQQQRTEVAQQATQLLAALQHMQQDMLDRAERMVVGLAKELHERLLLELTPEERIAAMLRRIRQEAPPKLVEPVLWLHPDDMARVPDCDWERKADLQLAPGSCRLAAASGEWHAGFELACTELRRALDQLAAAPDSKIPAPAGN